MNVRTISLIDFVIASPDGGGGDGAPDAQAAADQTSGLSGGDWLQAGIIVGVGIVLAMVVAKGVRKIVSKHNELVAMLAGRVAALLVFIVAFVYGLNSVGVAVGPLVGALGIGGFALAFALRDILQNILAGVLIQIRRPFEIGHMIKLNDFLGRVQDVTLRTVVVDAVNGEQVIIPCADVISNPIENWSANEHRRTDVIIGVPYDADFDAIIPALEDAMRNVEGAIDFKDPMVLVDEFAGSSVNVRLLVWHDLEETHFLVFKSRVAQAAKACLNDNGLSVPFPIRTLEVGTSGPLADLVSSRADDSPTTDDAE